MKSMIRIDVSERRRSLIKILWRIGSELVDFFELDEMQNVRRPKSVALGNPILNFKPQSCVEGLRRLTSEVHPQRRSTSR